MEKSTQKVLIVGGGVVAATLAFMYFSKKASASTKGGEQPTKIDPNAANCTGNWVSEVPPPEVQFLLNPHTISAGAWTSGPVYANQKGTLWRFSNPMGYARCTASVGAGAPARMRGAAINHQLAPVAA